MMAGGGQSAGERRLGTSGAQRMLSPGRRRRGVHGLSMRSFQSNALVAGLAKFKVEMVEMQR